MTILECVGCFYHCYKRPDLTAAVLENFRRHYPTDTVHLISDGGNDFSAVAGRFNCVYHHEANIGYQVDTTKDLMHEWLRRLRYCCEGCPEEWMLVLEDDVLVKRKMLVPTYPIAGADSRFSKDAYTGGMGEYVFGRHPHLVNNGYGGGGGTVFHRKTFLDCLCEYFSREDFDAWTLMFGNRNASDLWLTNLFMVCGYQYGPYADLVIKWRNRRWHLADTAIVHGY